MSRLAIATISRRNCRTPSSWLPISCGCGRETTEYYLDPSARFYPFGILPWYETQASGVRVNKNGVEFVTTPLPPSSDAILARSASLEIDEEGTVSGTVQVEFKGQRAALWREDERNEDEAGRRKKLERCRSKDGL